MTEPLMPTSYVFTPDENGGTAPRAPGLVYVGLPSGVSTLVLTWWGNAFCRLRMQPTGYGGVDRTLFTLPKFLQQGIARKSFRLPLMTQLLVFMFRRGQVMTLITWD